jgi:hypothetical protein
MSFVSSFTHQISQVASKVAIKLYLVKPSAPIAITELPQQFNGMIEDDGFAIVCSEEQQQRHTTDLVVQNLRDQIGQLQVKIANSAHISLSGKSIVAAPTPVVELSDIDIPKMGITLTQQGNLVFQTAKIRFMVESLRKHRTSREVCLARRAWNSSKS